MKVCGECKDMQFLHRLMWVNQNDGDNVEITDAEREDVPGEWYCGDCCEYVEVVDA